MTRLFRTCNVRVVCDGSAPRGDVYAVVEAAERRLRLKTLPGHLQAPPPDEGALVMLRTALPDALYTMPARVVERDMGEEVRLAVEPAGEVERTQRRENFRVPVSVPVQVVELPLSEASPLELVTEDLSAGGLRILSPCDLGEGSVVRVSLTLKELDRVIHCRTRIVRSLPRGPDSFETGGQFLKLRTPDEDRLVRALTAAMRQWIRE